MKIREGFISNSSSTSFIVIATTENFQRAFDNSDPYIQSVVNEMGHNKGKCFGRDVKVISYADDHGSAFSNIEVSEELYPEDARYCKAPRCAFDHFCSLLNENLNEVFYHIRDGKEKDGDKSD